MTMLADLPKVITVFGGSGFLGRHITRALAKRGYRVRAAVRRPDLAMHLQPLGDVGQIAAVQANVRHKGSVGRAVEGADAAINLVGILAESGKQRFNAVQELGARAVAEACRDRDIPLVQGSAIGADPDGESEYARSKGRGEDWVRRTLADRAIVMRPSIVFGPEDDFFNRFADMARFSPALPLIGGGTTKFQPVYVGDVAEAFAQAIDGKLRGGATYELGGPEVMSFRKCLEEMLEVTERKRIFVNIPWWAAHMQGKLFQMLPGQLLTEDQVVQLKTDNVVSQAAIDEGRTLEAMGITGKTVEAILPTYLWRFRRAGQYRAPIERADLNE
ncbi:MULTISPECIES: complex I NDUFA9 subunit family protein [unclassified Roseitalea]|uniref:complex I NDUFA9 subunit family protein n=1 Tax=unclassified Roseitalea TaxID=2639107 RepID=UPI00273EF8E2|nr:MULTISPECIES: complex I NDUFA9 subunit family protein [unclassified Roseitalea]